MKLMRPASLFKRFGRHRGGAVTLEFAILSVPFLMLLLMILNTALMYYIGTTLDAATTFVAREVRVGSLTASNTTLASVKSAICARIANVANCSDNLYVTAQVVSSSTDTLQNPLDSTGHFRTDPYYITGAAGDYVMFRAFLPWPAFFAPLGTGPMVDGSYLLASAVFFCNEPFSS